MDEYAQVTFDRSGSPSIRKSKTIRTLNKLFIYGILHRSVFYLKRSLFWIDFNHWFVQSNHGSDLSTIADLS